MGKVTENPLTRNWNSAWNTYLDMSEGPSSSLCSVQRLMMRWWILTHYCWFRGARRYVLHESKRPVLPMQQLLWRNKKTLHWHFRILQLHSTYFTFLLLCHEGTLSHTSTRITDYNGTL